MPVLQHCGIGITIVKGSRQKVLFSFPTTSTSLPNQVVLVSCVDPALS